MLISITERRAEPDARRGAPIQRFELLCKVSELFVVLLLLSSYFPSLFQWVIASKKLALRWITPSTLSLILVIPFPCFIFIVDSMNSLLFSPFLLLSRGGFVSFGVILDKLSGNFCLGVLRNGFG